MKSMGELHKNSIREYPVDESIKNHIFVNIIKTQLWFQLGLFQDGMLFGNCNIEELRKVRFIKLRSQR